MVGPDLTALFLVACHNYFQVLAPWESHSTRPLPLCDYVTFSETSVHRYRNNVKKVG